MISQTIAGPAMCFHWLIEEHHEHPPCDYKYYVAGEAAEYQLRDDYEAERDELVASVGEELEEGGRGGVRGSATDTQEVEKTF